MALDANDLDQIRQVFNEGIEILILPRFDEIDRHFGRVDKRLDNLEADVSTLKSDMSVLKTDVSTLKTDVSTLKIDVSALKIDMREANRKLTDLGGKVEALDNDIRELYQLVSQKQSQGKSYDKLSIEQKFLKMHSEFAQLAKQAGIVLPV